MKFIQTPLAGAYVIELEPVGDERGIFARTFCQKEFQAHGLNPNIAQCNISFNNKKSTLRGMHYQAAPFQETKLVKCTRGEIYDVVVDLRQESPTFRQWFGITLSPDKHQMLYIPKDFAHGYITLKDDSEVLYCVSEFYQLSSEKGVRWDDPVFSIQWPIKPDIISNKDRNFPDFK